MASMSERYRKSTIARMGLIRCAISEPSGFSNMVHPWYGTRTKATTTNVIVSIITAASFSTNRKWGLLIPLWMQ